MAFSFQMACGQPVRQTVTFEGRVLCVCLNMPLSACRHTLKTNCLFMFSTNLWVIVNNSFSNCLGISITLKAKYQGHIHTPLMVGRGSLLWHCQELLAIIAKIPLKCQPCDTNVERKTKLLWYLVPVRVSDKSLTYYYYLLISDFFPKPWNLRGNISLNSTNHLCFVLL